MSFKKTVQSFSPLVLVLFLAISCKKGDPGPAGPAGATGAAGATGPAGPVGTANVIYSDWFRPDAYIKDTVLGIYGFNYNKPVAAITQKIIDSGTVITFGKLSGYVTAIWPTGQVSAMPISITYKIGANVNIDTWTALVTPGNLQIRMVNSLNAYGGINNAHQFRYIIIPGGVKSTGSYAPGSVPGNNNMPVFDNASINEVIKNSSHMEYGEICRRLGIPQ